MASISLILKRLEEQFGIISSQMELNGVPQDLESAIMLANKEDDRTRKEFEKWSALKYSNNRAVINEKKGGDGGIDAIVYFKDINDNGKEERRQAIFSVKSNRNLTPSVIRDLNGTMEREGASIGILITLYQQPSLVKESKRYGIYKNNMLGHTYPKIQVITIEQMLAGETMKISTSFEVLKKAEQKSKTRQQRFDF